MAGGSLASVLSRKRIYMMMERFAVAEAPCSGSNVYPFLDILGPWCQRLTLELRSFADAFANDGPSGGAGFQRTASHQPLTNTLAIAR